MNLIELETATKQEVFNHIASGLLTQGERSYEGSACLYRGPNGLKCAGGMVIDDDEYGGEDMEDQDWEGLVEGGFAPSAHMELITKLQGVHDSYEPQEWGAYLRWIALDSGLSTLALDNHKAK
jgi:hypothetical protein